MGDVRKNQAKLSKDDWRRFVDATEAIRKPGAKAPRYNDFVSVHGRAMRGKAMHEWAVHSMVMNGSLMRGRNFLAWHRWFVRQFERRLQKEDERVTIPYWNWVSDPKLPPELNRPALLQRWNLTRQWDPSELPERSDVNVAMRKDKFNAFQSRLEEVHNGVHRAVGGEMVTSRSPADPLFWLHHSNIDRIWAQWQKKNPRKGPANRDERLKPASMFDVRVADVVRTAALGYRYG